MRGFMVAFKKLNYNPSYLELNKSIFSKISRKTDYGVFSSFEDKVSFYSRLNIINKISSHSIILEELLKKLTDKNNKIFNLCDIVDPLLLTEEEINNIPVENLDEVEEVLLNKNIIIINKAFEKSFFNIPKNGISLLSNRRKNGLYNSDWFDWFRIGGDDDKD